MSDGLNGSYVGPKNILNKANPGPTSVDPDPTAAIFFARREYTCRGLGDWLVVSGSFTVVVSGGSLIKSLRKLVEAPYIDSIDWSRWHMLWVDERVVPKDHPDSNYLLALDGFLSKVPIPAGNIYAINDALSAQRLQQTTTRPA